MKQPEKKNQKFLPQGERNKKNKNFPCEGKMGRKEGKEKRRNKPKAPSWTKYRGGGILKNEFHYTIIKKGEKERKKKGKAQLEAAHKKQRGNGKER